MSLPVWIGRYAVGEPIGHGSMAVVLRGEDTAIHRPVALKLIAKRDIDPAQLPGTLERFRHEMRQLTRLNHPRIAALYDFIETEEHACMVLELVAGKTLAARIRESPHHEFGEVRDIAAQVCDGLGHCHERGVVHRDLKPASILLGADAGIKITGFGTASGGPLDGSARCVAPEQSAGERCTELTDLYQVGAIVYEMLTGERPFAGTSDEVLRRVLHERPPNPSLINPRIPPQIDWVIQKALATDPCDRFESIHDFSEALARVLERRAA